MIKVNNFKRYVEIQTIRIWVKIKEMTLANKLKVKIFATRLDMGMEAANDVSEKIKELLLNQAPGKYHFCSGTITGRISLFLMSRIKVLTGAG